jgi:hypothetical protein
MPLNRLGIKRRLCEKRDKGLSRIHEVKGIEVNQDFCGWSSRMWEILLFPKDKSVVLNPSYYDSQFDSRDNGNAIRFRQIDAI